jgi:hypothetical protein
VISFCSASRLSPFAIVEFSWPKLAIPGDEKMQKRCGRLFSKE